MRKLASAAAVAAALALALTACSGGGTPPTATPASRGVAEAYRCLADHSPWSVDLDAAHAEWSGAADTSSRAVAGGEVVGTATVSFTRAESPAWTFTATGVDYELYFADGTRERTSLGVESSGRYVIPEPGDTAVLSRVRVTATSEETQTIASDGTTTSTVAVAAPRFPWLVGSEVAFTCTEHRLVFSTPGQVPASWTLLPGV